MKRKLKDDNGVEEESGATGEDGNKKKKGKIEVKEEDCKVALKEEGGEVEVKEEGGNKVEVKEEGGKVEVKEEGGKVEVKAEGGKVEVKEEGGKVEVKEEDCKVEVKEEDCKVEVKEEDCKVEVKAEGGTKAKKAKVEKCHNGKEKEAKSKEGGIVSSKGSKTPRKRMRAAYTEVLKQMEFYFSDANLAKSNFMSELLGEDGDAWVDLDVFLKFNKLTAILRKHFCGRAELDDLWKALSKVCPDSALVEVRDEKNPESLGKRQVRRRVKFKPRDPSAVEASTVYAENVPAWSTNDTLREHFSQFGTVDYVSLPRYKNTGAVKGFAFVEFSDRDSAVRALSRYGAGPDDPAPTERDPEQLCSVQAFHKEQEQMVEEKLIRDKGKVAKTKEDEHEKTKADTEKKANGDADKDQNAEGEEQETKIKKKRKRGKRKSAAMAVAAGQIESEQYCGADPKEAMSMLTVMAKKDWKKLRNTYLDMQRKHMSKAKGRLRKQQQPQQQQQQPQQQQQQQQEQRQQQPAEKEGDKPKKEQRKLELVPNTVVKFELSEPVLEGGGREMLKKKVRCAFIDAVSVKYVDVRAGSSVYHVRCATEEQAARLAKVSGLGKSCILSGEEESAYWLKAEEDRREKTSGRVPKKAGAPPRGKEKLVNKLQQGTHKYFDE